ncbi:MAG: peptide deformylase [Gemmatimonadetes bacterium]|nr:peptide deformylase [Gemmatimonadota bacterium]
MSAREIVLLGDPILRARAAAVGSFDDELRELVRDMFDTMYSAEGAGLAAPQVGVGIRVIVAEIVEEGVAPVRVVLVNPEIVETSDEIDRDSEGCLSIPGVSEVVARPASVTVQGLDPTGSPVRVEAGGLLARVLQHEVDHVNGVLFIDRLTPLKRRILLQKYRKLGAKD